LSVSVILAHPRAGSFNHAIAETVVSTCRELGHCVIHHDLYAEGFDPILPYDEVPRDAPVPPEVRRHCDEIAAAEGIVIVHPNWWGQPPAILKGWIDRVLRLPVGLLQARAALVFNTSNTPEERELRAFGDPLEALWDACIFDLCGVPTVHRRMYRVIVTSTEAQRRVWLEDVRKTVRACLGGG